MPASTLLRERRIASLLRRHRAGLDVRVVQVLFLPDHHHVDAVAARRVIEEHELFERRRIELAVFAQMQRGLGEAVRLARGIDAENVRLRFLVRVIVLLMGVAIRKKNVASAISTGRPAGSSTARTSQTPPKISVRNPKPHAANAKRSQKHQAVLDDAAW